MTAKSENDRQRQDNGTLLEEIKQDKQTIKK